MTKDDINCSDIVCSPHSRRSLSGDVPDGVPAAVNLIGRDTQVGGEDLRVVRFVSKLHNGDDRLLVSVDNLTRHDGGEAAIEPRESTHVVDSDPLSDMKVGQSQRLWVERVTLLRTPPRTRRDVDDLDLGDQLVADLRVDGDLVDGDDVAGAAILDSDDNGLLVSHDGPFQLPRGDCRPLSVWRARLRMILYITRDEVSTAKET